MSTSGGPPDSERELQEIAEARLGRLLKGKWTLEHVLGIGGMATVYRGRHRNGKHVAIKMLHPQLSLSASLRKRFSREGYVANAVGHAGALSVDDDDVDDDGSAFLVMEYLEGHSLEEHEEPARRLPVSLVVAYVAEVLDVLAAAHDRNIVHRDIKPANLFVTHSGQVKVLDFGVARVRDMPAFSAAMTHSGAVIGTPAYMAPEQACGDTESIGPATDQWAVGATLFTLLSGELVHEARTMTELMIKATTEQARSLATVMPDAPAELVAIVDRALAYDPLDRWPSAGAMRDALLDLAPRLGEVPPRSEALGFALTAPDTTHASQPARASAPRPSASTSRSAPAIAHAASEASSGHGPIGTTTAAASLDTPSLLQRRPSRTWAWVAPLPLVIGAAAWWAGGVGAGAPAAEPRESPTTAEEAASSTVAVAAHPESEPSGTPPPEPPAPSASAPAAGTFTSLGVWPPSRPPATTTAAALPLSAPPPSAPPTADTPSAPPPVAEAPPPVPPPVDPRDAFRKRY